MTYNKLRSERDSQLREIEYLDLSDGYPGIAGEVNRVKALMKEEAGVRFDLAFAELNATNSRLIADEQDRQRRINPNMPVIGNPRGDQLREELKARDLRRKLSDKSNSISRGLDALERAKAKEAEKEAEEERATEDAKAKAAALAQEQARIDALNAAIAALKAEQQRQADAQRQAEAIAAWNLFQIEHPEEAAKIIREREEAAKRARDEAERVEAARREAERKAAAEKAERERREAEARAKAEAERKAAERAAALAKALEGFRFDMRPVVIAYAQGMVNRACQDGTPQAYLTQLQASVAAFQAKDYPGVLTALPQAAGLTPDRDDAKLFAAMSTAISGNIDDAIKGLMALRASADPAIVKQAIHMLGKMKQYSLIDALPASAADAYDAEGTESLRQRNWSEAEAKYRAAAKAEPGDMRWHNILAFIFVKEQNWADAAAEYQILVKWEPTNISMLRELATCQMHMRAFSDAIATYREAIKLDPKNAALHDALGTAYWYGDMLNETINEYRLAVKYAKDDELYTEHLKKAIEAKKRKS